MELNVDTVWFAFPLAISSSVWPLIAFLIGIQVWQCPYPGRFHIIPWTRDTTVYVLYIFWANGDWNLSRSCSSSSSSREERPGIIKDRVNLLKFYSLARLHGWVEEIYQDVMGLCFWQGLNENSTPQGSELWLGPLPRIHQSLRDDHREAAHKVRNMSKWWDIFFGHTQFP